MVVTLEKLCLTLIYKLYALKNQWHIQKLPKGGGGGGAWRSNFIASKINPISYPKFHSDHLCFGF